MHIHRGGLISFLCAMLATVMRVIGIEPCLIGQDAIEIDIETEAVPLIWLILSLPYSDEDGELLGQMGSEASMICLSKTDRRPTIVPADDWRMQLENTFYSSECLGLPQSACPKNE